MPERPPVWRWECCLCRGNNSGLADMDCAVCSNHWRGGCCKVWDDAKRESELRRVNSRVSQPSIIIPPSASSSSPRPVSDRRPVIIQLAPPNGQQSPATTAPLAGTSSAINYDRKSLRGDLVSDTPEHGEGGSDAGKLSRAISIDHPLQTRAKQQRFGISRVCTDESKSRQSSLSGATSEETRGGRDVLWSTKSLNPPAKATTKSKRGILVTQDRPKPQERVASPKDDARNDDLPASQERSEDKRNNTTDSVSAQHGNHDQTPKHIQREAKRPLTKNLVRSRSPSPRSDVADSGWSDAESLPSRNVNDLHAGKEVRLRVDATTPLSFQINGDMEGRTMQSLPTEGGMAELVISSGRDSKHPNRYRTYEKQHEADPARNRRLSNPSSAVEADHHQDYLHTKQAEQERERKNRNSTMVYNRPTVWDDSSESESEEDAFPGNSQASVPLRRRSTNVDSREGKERVAQKARRYEIRAGDGREDTSKTSANSSRQRFTPSQSARDNMLSYERAAVRRRPVINNYATRRPTPESVYTSGAVVIQPATRDRQRRRPGTARPMSYSKDPRLQYHLSPVITGYPTVSPTPSAMYSQGTYITPSRNDRERARETEKRRMSHLADPLHVDTKRPDVSPYSMHAKGQLYPPVDSNNQNSPRSNDVQRKPIPVGVSAWPSAPSPRPPQHDVQYEKMLSDDNYRRYNESSRRQSISRPPAPPREAQLECPTRRGSVYVNDNVKAEPRRLAHYGTLYQSRVYAEHVERRDREVRLAIEAESREHEAQLSSSIGGKDASPHTQVESAYDVVNPVTTSSPHAITKRISLSFEEDTSKDEERERIYLKKKKRWSAGIVKRSHSQSVEPQPQSSDDFQRKKAMMKQTLEAPKWEQMAKQLATLTGPTGTPTLTAHSPQVPQQPTTLAESATLRKPTRVESPQPEYTAPAVKYSLQSSDTLGTSGLKNPGLLTNTSQDLAFESLDMLSDAQSVSAKDPIPDRGTHEGDLGSINPISEPENGTMLPENAFNQDFRAPEELAESLISPCAPAFGDTAADVNMVDAVGLELPSNLLVPGHSTVDTWLDMEVAHSSHGYSDWDYDCSLSGPSSYAASVASVFSVTSLASSASVISRGSGYSAVQIATATKVLLAIFYEDENLLSLYTSAIENQSIGPERLQRNLRRLFRAYAGLLEGEATERLEYLASRLVLIKSALLARCIVEKLQNGRVGVQLPRKEHNEESSDEEDNNADARAVNEDAFEDLAIFREFLVESEAFRTFRVRLQTFIIPKSTHLTHPEPVSNGDVLTAKTVEPTPIKAVTGHRKALTWQKWRNDSKESANGFFCGAYGKTTASSVFHLMTDAFMLATDDILIAAGLLEPPLRPDMIRLRWRCTCGESLHDDVAELRKGGIIELMDHMQRTSGAKVCASPHSHQSGNQQYIVPHPFQWIRKTVTTALGHSTKSSACLPQHNTACTVNVTTTNPSSPHSILHLLACMHRNRLRKVLQQDRIEDVTTDRTLLCFLRKQYLRHRGRFLHLLSLKSVKGISFVKFRLPIGGSVDVRHHDPCCITNNTGQITCECIPPLPKVEPSPGAEYRCIPGPPATYPPIPPVYLASLFACPTDVHEKDTWILDQLPKRTCGELQGQIGQPAEGWGIYYDEGLDRDMLALTILVVFFVASLLFGILWSRFQYDVQGAFGVSAYMIACCAVLLPVIVTQLENKG